MTEWIEDLANSRAYRQWAPARHWDAAQEEKHLLFMHFEVEGEQVRRLLPPELSLQLFQGSAWVGIAALEVKKARFHYLRLPRLWRRFPEVDFMTFVSYEGRSGVYFLSIESDRALLAPWIRRTAALPYLYSGLKIAADGDAVRVRSGPRSSEGGAMAALDVTYRPQPGEQPVDPHSPIFELIEQYSTFVIDRRGRVRELDEVHASWSPMEAEVEVHVNTLGLALGIDLPERPTLAHYAEERRILTWLPRVVKPGRPGLAPVNPRR